MWIKNLEKKKVLKRRQLDVLNRYLVMMNELSSGLLPPEIITTSDIYQAFGLELSSASNDSKNVLTVAKKGTKISTHAANTNSTF